MITGGIAMAEHGRLIIGTCGWSYKHWLGPFYPAGTKPARMLEHYTRCFSGVEINSSFYRLPAPENLAQWSAQTPKGFVFTCKASRYITHMKKLKDPGRSFAPFFERIGLLGKRLKVVVFQLPPRWQCNPERLEDCLAALPQTHRYAFELRDESWFDPVIYEALRRHDAALCIYDLGGRRSPLKVTSDFVYLRLHGPAEVYAGAYDDQQLNDLAIQIHDWRRSRLDVFVFFDNDAKGQAPLDALKLQDLLTASG